MVEGKRKKWFKKWIGKLKVLRLLRQRGCRGNKGYLMKQETEERRDNERHLVYQLAWAEEIRAAKAQDSGQPKSATLGEYEAMTNIDTDLDTLEHRLDELRKRDSTGENWVNLDDLSNQLIREMMVKHVDVYGMNRISEIYRQIESRYDYRWRMREVKNMKAVDDFAGVQKVFSHRILSCSD